MAITIKHAKTDTIADWTQSDLDAQIALGNFPPGTLLADIVLPSDWNNDHTLSGTVPIANGGTGQTTANAALNALLPSQTSNNGKVLSTDGTNTSWIAAGGTGTVTSVTGTAPVAVATGTTTPVISMHVADTTNDGYLSSTDWNTFNSKAPATSGTSILYGNGSGGFSNVTIGSNLTFSGGTLSATGGGGMTYPSAGIPYSTGSAWGTSYTTTGSGTIIALQTNPTLYNPNIDVIDFDTTYSTALTAGQLGWDGNNTLGLGMIGGNVVQHIGEDSFIYIKASSAITKGQVVMFTGAVGASAVPTGAPATGVTDGTYIMGIAAESIALNGFGLVQTFGTLRNVNTTGYVDGDILWYNPAVTGGLTKTTPSAPNVKVQVAAVLNGGSAGGGSILVRVNAGSALGGTDSNVQITSVVNGQILTYDGTNAYWKNTTPVAGTGITLSSSSTGVLTVTNSAPDQTVAISGTSPVSVTGTYPNFTVSMTQASTSTDGWLSSTDWNTFNNKGSGTVTSVSAVAPVTSSGGATPIISMAAATGSVSGYLTSTDWTTFNGKQTAYTNLSTFGALSNSAGWLYNNGTGTLSYSTPTAAQVGAVPTTRSLTINGTAYDLSADRTWSVGTVTSVAALTIGTTGTDITSTVATGTTTPVITLNVPTASATNRGALSAADWTTFNNKGSGTVTSVSVVSANGLAGTVATATSTPAITLSTTVTGIVKGNGTSLSAAVSGTDYAPATSGSSILYGNGSGGFSNVTVGTGLSFSTGTLSSTVSMVYPSAGIAVSTGSAWGTSLTAPSGTIVGTTDTQTLTNKTFTGFTETVYAVVDAAGVAISPTNGTIQTWTLGASRTPTAGTWAAGQSLTLMIDDGTAYTVTWTTLGVTWVGGTAPTLATTGYTVVELWKVGSTIYGSYVGAV